MTLHQTYESYREAAVDHERARRFDAAWACLEAMHVLGQRRTVLHVRAHLAMLGFAWRRRNARELLGQLLRIAGASVLTWVWVPRGNTGGTNVSLFKSMPIPEDLQETRTKSGSDHQRRPD